jgi:hypothetical protein
MQASDASYALCLAALQPWGLYTVYNAPLIKMSAMQKAWDKEHHVKKWFPFELHNESQTEKLCHEDEKMVPIDKILARIE